MANDYLIGGLGGYSDGYAASSAAASPVTPAFTGGQTSALQAQHVIVNASRNSRQFDSIPLSDPYWSTVNTYIKLYASYL